MSLHPSSKDNSPLLSKLLMFQLRDLDLRGQKHANGFSRLFCVSPSSPKWISRQTATYTVKRTKYSLYSLEVYAVFFWTIAQYRSLPLSSRKVGNAVMLI